MTISTTDSKIQYNGNGITLAFAFPYRFLQNADLNVILISAAGLQTTQVLNTDYTVTGAGLDAGGTVTMAVAPPSGSKLLIRRVVQLTQETDYISGDPFPAESHERALDKLTMGVQQTLEVVNRALVIPSSDTTGTDVTLPRAADRADQLLSFDSNGNPVAVAPTSDSSTQLRLDLASFADGNGSELVAFLPDGADAVATTTQTKLRETISQAEYLTAAAALAEALEGSAIFIDNDQTTLITVGTGGTAATINEALRIAERIRPIYKTGGVMVEIRLLTGFVMAEQVIIDGKDFSFCRITSVDPTVTIQRSALTTLVFFDYYPAWCAQNGAVLPIIDCLFTMDATGTATYRDGFFINYGSKVIFEFDAGCTNAGSRGLHVANGSTAVARKTNFSGALEIGVRVSGGSVVQLREATVTGCGASPAPGETAANLAIDGGCVVYAAGADLSSGVVYGVNCLNSQVSLNGADVSGCGSDNVRLRRGSIADLASADLTLAGQDGVFVEGSQAVMTSAQVTGATRHGLNATNAHVQADFLSANSCGQNAIQALQASVVEATSAVLTNAGSYGAFAVGNSSINCRSADGTGAAVFGAGVAQGGLINSSLFTGTLSKAVNGVNAAGIIFG